MLTRFRRLPWPALVLSALALIGAIGGGTFAVASSSDSKIDRRIATKIANRQISQRAPGLSVGHAATADSATRARHATTADSAALASHAETATHAHHATTAASAAQASHADTAAHAHHATTAASAAQASHAETAIHAHHATSAITATTAANASGLEGPLASGHTLTGSFGIAGNKAGPMDSADQGALSFPIPLKSAPAFNVVPPGGPSTLACPGTVNSPTAAAGELCLYEAQSTGANGLGHGPDFPSRFGTDYFPFGTTPGANYVVSGNWAVTAP
jgi:hypothetical protein